MRWLKYTHLLLWIVKRSNYKCIYFYFQSLGSGSSSRGVAVIKLSNWPETLCSNCVTERPHFLPLFLFCYRAWNCMCRMIRGKVLIKMWGLCSTQCSVSLFLCTLCTPRPPHHHHHLHHHYPPLLSTLIRLPPGEGRLLNNPLLLDTAALVTMAANSQSCFFSLPFFFFVAWDKFLCAHTHTVCAHSIYTFSCDVGGLSLSVPSSSWRTVHLWTEFKCCDSEGMQRAGH